MRLLVIGGGWFAGRALVDAAVALGWHVTTFSRTGNGDRPGVEAVHGDRTNCEDLARLAARGAWDAVVDVPGVVPVQVRDSVRALAEHVGRYVFVSSVSAYLGWPAVPVTDGSPLRIGDPDEDPGAWQWGRGVYGRLKAGAEAALRRDLPPDRLFIFRPGVILGPGEYSGRLTWWLSRVARGGRVLAPGQPDRPIQRAVDETSDRKETAGPVITVIPAEPTHAEALAALAEEMDRFYGETRSDPLYRRLRQIHEALFSTPSAGHAILAWDRDRPIGFASYSFLWPAVGLTRSLYLKELYVSEVVRRDGVGRLLMQSVCQIAVKHGCSRVEWTTDRDNAGARAFYASLGLLVNESKLFYRLEGENLGRIGSSS